MQKIVKIIGVIAICLFGLMAIIMVGYGLYQQSQLYPAIHQQIGFQACVAEVQKQAGQVKPITPLK